MNQQQLEKMHSGQGFVAALDQSGGSTPKALGLYGVNESQWNSEEEMFELVHAMRSRIITSPAFSGDKILGAILFERTMDSEIDGQPTAAYLWEKKQVVPFLKIDKGLAEVSDGVQVMKPFPELDQLLDKAVSAGIFGTKMRSVIKEVNESSIAKVVDQQFEWAKQIIAKGLVPIVEPEVDIHSPTKAEAEGMLKAQLAQHLDSLNETEKVILKLTLPEETNLYSDFVTDPRVVRVVALSGGYPREEANRRLSENNGVIASFSRALSEGLSADQSEDEFNATLAESIESIYQASVT